MKPIARLRSLVRRALAAVRGPRAVKTTPSPEWRQLQRALMNSRRVIDLGCGANPIRQATVAIDAYLDPRHRQFGQGDPIDAAALANRGCRFVQAELSCLPFADRSFDFAYSHHVIEHVADPGRTCNEIMRIAKAGGIVTPSPFAEIAFGRPYHRWFVQHRANTLIFVEKTPEDDRPFGRHPERIGNGFALDAQTNPFDLLLNAGGWYRGREAMPRLGNRLRELWYSHSPVIETVFVWRSRFDWLVIRQDGSVESSRMNSSLSR